MCLCRHTFLFCRLCLVYFSFFTSNDGCVHNDAVTEVILLFFKKNVNLVMERPEERQESVLLDEKSASSLFVSLFDDGDAPAC